MAKPTKTAPREGEIERKPFTGDLQQQILAGFKGPPRRHLGFSRQGRSGEPPACRTGAQVRGIFRDAGWRPGGSESGEG
jgi:hypothetical protein